MLSEFYQWIKNIVVYLIFMSLVLKMLPEEKSAKYIRYFMGMVLVLIVLAPAGKLFRMEEAFKRWEADLEKEGEKTEFEEELRLKGEEYEETVIREYEEQAQKRAEELLLEKGYGEARVEIRMDGEKDSETFGEILSLTVDFVTEKNDRKEEAIRIERKEILIYDEDAAGLPGEEGETNYREEAENKAVKKLLGEAFSTDISRITVCRG